MINNCYTFGHALCHHHTTPAALMIVSVVNVYVVVKCTLLPTNNVSNTIPVWSNTYTQHSYYTLCDLFNTLFNVESD